MTRPALPPRLAGELERDLRPVKPLPHVALAVAAVAAVALLIAVGVLSVAALRPDLGRLGPWLAWGVTAVQGLIGILLIYAALRESIPGAALPARLRTVFVASGVVLQAATAVATWVRSPTLTPPGALGTTCFRNELVLAAPALLLTVALAARAYPLRPSVAGLLAGLGSGLVADLVQHLLCPISDLHHVLVWHTGAVLVLMAGGWIFGRLWEHRRTGKLFSQTES